MFCLDPCIWICHLFPAPLDSQLGWVTLALTSVPVLLGFLESLPLSSTLPESSAVSQDRHQGVWWPCSLAKSCPVRLPCPSLSPRLCSNSGPLSWWCHPTISSSVLITLLLLPSIFPSIKVFSSETALWIRWPKYWNSASILPMNIQDWFPLGLTGLICFLSKGFSRVFSNTTVSKHQFFYFKPSLLSNSRHTGLLKESYLWLHQSLLAKWFFSAF